MGNFINLMSKSDTDTKLCTYCLADIRAVVDPAVQSSGKKLEDSLSLTEVACPEVDLVVHYNLAVRCNY